MIEEDLKEIHKDCSADYEAKNIVVNKLGYLWKLGEEVNNGIRYFGQQRKNKDSVTALFICHCGEAWRCRITSIVSGASKSCGCTNNKKMNRVDDV